MHDEHSHTKSELWLARQLRDAARREAPAFSESLHQRIMQAVQPAELSVASPTDPQYNISRRRSYWRSIAWIATAAAAIFAMVIAARQLAGPNNTNSSQPASVQAVVVVPSKSIEAISGSTGTNEIASLTANYTLDDLTRDAQATAHLLVDQLPFETPADEWGL